MYPAFRKARVEWYDALKERDSTAYYAWKKRCIEVDKEQHALPPKERLTIQQRADLVDADFGIRDDAGFWKRLEVLKSEQSKKRNKTIAKRMAERDKPVQAEEPDEDSEAGLVSVPQGENPPGEELPSSGGIGPVGNPRDILWAVEYLGDDSVGKGDSPSGTAWTLLCAGRKSPDSLLRIYQQVCVPSKKELEDAADEADAFDHLDDVLRRVIEIAEGAVA
jgi:hypothetical protein